MEVVGALENDPDSTQRQDHRGFLQKHALFKEVGSSPSGQRLCLHQLTACNALHCGRDSIRASNSVADGTACDQPSEVELVHPWCMHEPPDTGGAANRSSAPTYVQLQVPAGGAYHQP